ncbi:uncharacterized protein LOC142150808 [Mixophyes fleayi]|uniref:uncharacterized protein LOC142150808 n=1 Tax=Mixophyes fleayi TaxID=3061075 RepID=UPI003F4E2C25
MKIAIAFLLVSLNCCFTLPVDKKDTPSAPVPKVPQPEPKPEPKIPESVPKPVPKEPQPVPKVPQPVPKVPQPAPKVPQPVPKVPQPVPKVPQPAPKPAPKIECLIQLLKKDAPALLQNLGNLLCNYRVAQKEQNAAYFISFLEQVENVLKQVGCSLNNLLGTKVVINAQNAENLANKVAVILFQFLEDIIARVMKILNDVPLTEDVRDLTCGLLESVLGKIARILSIVADVTGGLTKIIDGL